jgi:hypothetical protein
MTILATVWLDGRPFMIAQDSIGGRADRTTNVKLITDAALYRAAAGYLLSLVRVNAPASQLTTADEPNDTLSALYADSPAGAPPV